MPPHLVPRILAAAPLWLIAAAWVWKVITVTQGIRQLPDLCADHFNQVAPIESTLTVIVPARNEAASVEACLRSLLAQDLPGLHIIAVDDRSTDGTAGILDRLAAEAPRNLEVQHIAELPPGWLGKPHAMALAAEQAMRARQPRWLLFTDGDILFAPDALRRALVAAEQSSADHFVLLPTTIIRRWDEAPFLAFFSTLGLVAGQPWKVGDPQAREHVGAGAFNLVRSEAYVAAGGFAALRMTIVEDIALGRLVKKSGLRQQAASGVGLVNVHWAAGVPGLINVMTKNLFSVMNYNIVLATVSSAALIALFIAPLVGLLFRNTVLPSAIALCGMFWLYRVVGQRTGLIAWLRNASLAPAAAALFVFALLRSTVVTLRQGGVIWRGTFYPLPALRRDGIKLT